MLPSGKSGWARTACWFIGQTGVFRASQACPLARTRRTCGLCPSQEMRGLVRLLLGESFTHICVLGGGECLPSPSCTIPKVVGPRTGLLVLKADQKHFLIGRKGSHLCPESFSSAFPKFSTHKGGNGHGDIRTGRTCWHVLHKEWSFLAVAPCPLDMLPSQGCTNSSSFKKRSSSS